MAKKVAVCVGQNEYGSADIPPLRGCVNDTLLIGAMLRKAGFEVRYVQNEAATQRGILDRLSIEIAKLRKGDYFVVWNSSHGYQVNDREHDELYDYRDEAICTYDTDPRDPLTDDKLSQVLSRADPDAEVFLGFDCCHSGTLTRAFVRAETVDGSETYRRPRLWVPPDDVRSRPGTQLIDLDAFIEGKSSSVDSDAYAEATGVYHLQPPPDLGLRRFGLLGREAQEDDMGHLFLGGCKAEQVSYDNQFSEGFYGAMTYHFAKAALAAWNNGKAITYREAHEVASSGVREAGFQQEPQLEGPDSKKDAPVFGYQP
jgi:hypothetical protein